MKSNTFPEINILSSSSVKKEDSNKFPTKKNVYKSGTQSELNINIQKDISTKLNSNQVNNIIINDDMNQKASNFNDINSDENYNMNTVFYNEHNFVFSHDDIYDSSNREPSESNGYLDHPKENDIYNIYILELGKNFLNELNNRHRNNNKFKVKQKHLGRKSKDNKEEGLHTKYSKDNGANKLIIQCMKNTTDCINSIIENFKIGKLYNPNLTKNLTLNVVDKKAFLEKEIKIYYEEHSKARHCLKENKDNYINNNREIIKKLYEMKERNIILIFEIPFYLYLRAFLNDEKNIIYENENLELNEDFKTLKECFNEGKDYYTLEQKAQYKAYIEQLINGQISPRKKKKYK
jgi:hypothetical protein